MMRLFLLAMVCATLDACATPHAPPEDPVPQAGAPEPVEEPITFTLPPTRDSTHAPVAFDSGRGALVGRR